MNRTDVVQAARTPDLVRAATLPVDEALSLLTGTAGGLTHADAAERLARVGPNAVRDHRTRAWSVLARQVRSPLLLLLAGTAVVSFFVGEPTTAIIIGVILAASVGLGFGNEYRAEQAARAMHTRLRHTVVALRDGRPERVDVTDLVPGDVVRLALAGPRCARRRHHRGLNNLLYDASQLAIPTDHVDSEQLRRPSHWDIGFIRRFMLLFGLISSLFDFVTFAVMLGVFQAGPDLFRTGWFVESLATQTLVIFAVRTRRVPFLRSRPSWQLTTAALGIVAVGFVIPMTPLAGPLGFTPLPIGFFLVLLAMVPVYLVLIELGKLMFYAEHEHVPPRPDRGTARRIHRRAGSFSRADR